MKSEKQVNEAFKTISGRLVPPLACLAITPSLKCMAALKTCYGCAKLTMDSLSLHTSIRIQLNAEFKTPSVI